jgi:hypothetical protein
MAGYQQGGLSTFCTLYACELDDLLRFQREQNPGRYYLLGGASPVADHFVVACGGEIVWDPAGRDAKSFTRGSDGYFWVYVIIPKSQTI